MTDAPLRRGERRRAPRRHEAAIDALREEMMFVRLKKPP
jgi:hypothetical protein